MSLYAFKINEEKTVEQISVVDLTLESPPCCLAVDYNNHLWVVQSCKEQPLVVFEVIVEGGSCKVCLKTSSKLTSFILDDYIQYIISIFMF